MLKNRSAIVTGSTSGLGLGIALALAKEGCNVMLNGLADKATIEKAKAQIAEQGGKVAFSGSDISQIDQVENMIDATMRAFGSADILINNATAQHSCPIEDFPLEKWDAIMAANLFSVYYATRKILPIMKHKGWGRIINISSVHEQAPAVNKIAYIAAKHGLIGMTKVTALETAKTGITCNTICPRQGNDAGQFTDTPEKRFVKPEDVGELTIFLCSDSAAHMNGQIISHCRENSISDAVCFA